METTYKIIGGDGREYGPVTLEELRAWVRDGRVGRQTLIWRSDQQSWIPAVRYQELAPEISALPTEKNGDLSLNPGAELVGFWPRVGAYFLDQIILNLTVFLFFGANPEYTTLDEMLREMGPRLAGSFLISTLYYTGMVGYFGATLGKMVIGARIVNLDGSGVGYGKAFLRFLATFLSGMLLGIGYLMVAFREDKRGLHDLMVGTRVIYKR